MNFYSSRGTFLIHKFHEICHKKIKQRIQNKIYFQEFADIVGSSSEVYLFMNS